MPVRPFLRVGPGQFAQIGGAVGSKSRSWRGGIHRRADIDADERRHPRVLAIHERPQQSNLSRVAPLLPLREVGLARPPSAVTRRLRCLVGVAELAGKEVPGKLQMLDRLVYATELGAEAVAGCRSSAIAAITR